MLIGQSMTMFVGQFITWFPPPSVAAVRHLVAQNAVALARDLALVHHQIGIDDVLGCENLPELLRKHRSILITPRGPGQRMRSGWRLIQVIELTEPANPAHGI
jgi:hypothetical protein